MKLQIEVDLGLSVRQKKLLRGCVVASAVIGVLGVGIAVAAPQVAAPQPFVDGEVLSTEKVNQNFADLSTRITSLEQRPVTRTGDAVFGPTTCTPQNPATGSRLIQSCANSGAEFVSFILADGSFGTIPTCFAFGYTTNGAGAPCAATATSPTTVVVRDCTVQSGGMHLVCIAP
jgi:hypothetical protein